jgi:hypothetical protein
MWYEKYYNKIAFSGDYWYNTEEEKLFRGASRAIHPRNTHSVRWFEYYYDEDKDEFIRLTNSDRRFRRWTHYTENQAEDKFPEYFI